MASYLLRGLPVNVFSLVYLRRKTLEQLLLAAFVLCICTPSSGQIKLKRFDVSNWQITSAGHDLLDNPTALDALIPKDAPSPSHKTATKNSSHLPNSADKKSHKEKKKKKEKKTPETMSSAELVAEALLRCRQDSAELQFIQTLLIDSSLTTPTATKGMGDALITTSIPTAQDQSTQSIPSMTVSLEKIPLFSFTSAQRHNGIWVSDAHVTPSWDNLSGIPVPLQSFTSLLCYGQQLDPLRVQGHIPYAGLDSAYLTHKVNPQKPALQDLRLSVIIEKLVKLGLETPEEQLHSVMEVSAKEFKHNMEHYGVIDDMAGNKVGSINLLLHNEDPAHLSKEMLAGQGSHAEWQQAAAPSQRLKFLGIEYVYYPDLESSGSKERKVIRWDIEDSRTKLLVPKTLTRNATVRKVKEHRPKTTDEKLKYAAMMSGGRGMPPLLPVISGTNTFVTAPGRKKPSTYQTDSNLLTVPSTTMDRQNSHSSIILPAPQDEQIQRLASILEKAGVTTGDSDSGDDSSTSSSNTSLTGSTGSRTPLMFSPPAIHTPPVVTHQQQYPGNHPPYLPSVGGTVGYRKP